MYLQGTAIWHPRCGPGPNENGTVLNGLGIENGHQADESRPDSKLDHSCSVSETQVRQVTLEEFGFRSELRAIY